MTLPIVQVDLATLTPPYPLEVPDVAGTEILQSGQVVVHGWSMGNTSSAAAGELHIYNGNDANGTSVGVVMLQPQTSESISIGPMGILCDVGLTVVSTVSSLRGALWVSRPVQ